MYKYRALPPKSNIKWDGTYTVNTGTEVHTCTRPDVYNRHHFLVFVIFMFSLTSNVLFFISVSFMFCAGAHLLCRGNTLWVTAWFFLWDSVTWCSDLQRLGHSRLFQRGPSSSRTGLSQVTRRGRLDTEVRQSRNVMEKVRISQVFCCKSVRLSFYWTASYNTTYNVL